MSNKKKIEKELYITCAISLVESINDDGYISLKGNKDVYRNILERYEKSASLFDYSQDEQLAIAEVVPVVAIPTPIVENYAESEDIEAEIEVAEVEAYAVDEIEDTINNAEAVDVAEVTIQSATEKENIEGLTDEDKALDAFWVENICNDTYRAQMPLVWSLCIPHGIYFKLKNLLKAVCKESVNLEYHSEKFFVYVAEFYKWEYVSRDENALDKIGAGIDARTIWENIPIEWKSYCYPARQNLMRLYSIYVLGGFPLNGIKSSVNGWRTVFESIYNQEPTDEICYKAEKALSHRTQAIPSSLNDEKGSWREYIKAVLEKPESLYADEDKTNNTLVKAFYDCLGGVKNQKIEEKFGVRYRIWKAGEKFYIKRRLRMNECNIEDYNESPADKISRKRVEKWLKTSDLPSTFALRIETEQWSPRYKFVAISPETYRSDIWESEFDLPNLTDENASLPIDIYFENQACDINCKVSSEKLKFPETGYVVFRQDSIFEWQDKASARGEFNKSGVLFNTKQWQVPEQDVYYPISGYAWCEYVDSITLESLTGKKSVTLYNTKERLWIKPNEDSIHPIAKHSFVKFAFNEDKRVKVSGNGIDKGMAFLLKHPVKFDVVRSEDNTMISDNPKVEKRCPGESRYTEYNPADTSLEGYVTFRVTTHSGMKKNIEGYILHSDATLSRHLGSINTPGQGGSIIFRHPQGTQTKDDRWDDSRCYEEVVEMEIKDGEYTFALNVVRPFARRDRFRGKHWDNENNAIPIRFSKQYCVRVMDEYGVRRIEVDADHRPAIMSRLLEWLLNNPTGTGEIRQADLTYVVYTNEIQHKPNGVVHGYYIDSGNEVNADNLQFKFLSLDDGSLTDVSLIKVSDNSQGARTTHYLMLDLPNCREGVVLQSLDKDNYPLKYYRPKFISATQERVNNQIKLERRARRLCGYASKYKDLSLRDIPEDVYKDFDVACETGCYYSSLDRLLALIYTPPGLDVGLDEERMAKFYVGYCNYCFNYDKEINYTELWRMAEELCCDWLTIRRSVWKKLVGEDERKKSLVVQLLLKRPKEFYKRLLDNYWSLNWRNQRGCAASIKEARGFLKYILGGEGNRPSGNPSRDAINSEVDRLKNN